MKKQDNLRYQVKIAKVQNPDWSYRDMSEVINISVNAFYNWLNGYYQLSYKKAHELECLISDLIS